MFYIWFAYGVTKVCFIAAKFVLTGEMTFARARELVVESTRTVLKVRNREITQAQARWRIRNL